MIRDFNEGTVAVWNGRGQELTAGYLEGKDEYPIGKHLLGLDAEEFEKCAFVRQEQTSMSISPSVPSYLSRVIGNDSVKKGLAGAAAGLLIAVIREAIWPTA